MKAHEVDSMHEQQVVDVIARWKEQPRNIAEKLLKQYGAPDEVTSERLVWHNNGPWKRSELVNEEIPHNFPEPHHDSLLQVIPYRVPPEAGCDLLAFDGSVVSERTRGELGARCDDETANYLVLNLAHEIITGKKIQTKRGGFTRRRCNRKTPGIYERLFVPRPDHASG